MSLSKDTSPKLPTATELPEADSAQETTETWGTIYSQGREHALGGVEQRRSTQWSPEDEDNYLARVKEKAQEMAKNILDQARQEAQNIKDHASQEGYEQGLAAAQEELDSFRAGMGDSVAAVLATIEGQCGSIFQQWREEIIAVSKLAIEKITVMELSRERQPMLEQLLSQSIALLEKRKELVIKVNPEDEPVIADIIGLTKEKFPDIKAWRVVADASVEAGGMVVESESSIAESRLESRKLAVEEVLAHLTLPGVP